jgi:hypothetical protein
MINMQLAALALILVTTTLGAGAAARATIAAVLRLASMLWRQTS